MGLLSPAPQQGASLGDHCYFGQQNCPAGAWTGSGQGGIVAQNTWNGNGSVSAPDTGFVQWQGSIQQTFTAPSTGAFRVQWQAAGRGPDQGNETYHAEINGQNLGSFSTISGSAFQQQSSAVVSLVAGQSYILRFVGDTNADQMAYIDAVALLAVGQPDPGGLADGGFDQQGASVTQSCYIQSCPAGAWDGANGGGIVIQGNWNGNGSVSPTHTGFIQWGGVLQQSFVAPATGTYTLQWWTGGRGPDQGNESYHLELNGQVLGSSSTTSGSPFQQHSIQNVALTAGQAYTLRFVGDTNGDQIAYVDSVAFAAPSGAPASGPETISYGYDAKGRLTQVAHTGGPVGGQTTTYAFDAADNRASVVTSGTPVAGPVPAVADASFEMPSVGSGSSSNPSADGIAFTGRSGVAGNGSIWGFAPAPDHTQVAWLQGYGGAGGQIVTTLSNLVPGRNYQITFQAAQRPGYAVNPITVTLGGQSLGTFTPGSTQFQPFQTATFTANAALMQATFAGAASSGDTDVGVDAVAVVSANSS